MLAQLRLENFIFIDALTIDFSKGMTALTGETGAGKSILCEALWFALGTISDKTIIQQDKPFCYVEAQFTIDELVDVKAWLLENTYSDLSQPSYCCVARRISQNGRSQVWINQKVATIKDLKWLSTRLLMRHSQHDQQQLLLSEYQKQCLDRYGNYRVLLQSVEDCYEEYAQIEKKRECLLRDVAVQRERLDWVRYQLKELEEMCLQVGELEMLDQQQRRLAHAHQILEDGQSALLLVNEAEPVHLVGLLQNVQHILQKIMVLDDRFEPIYTTFERAALEVTDAETELRYLLSAVTVDPAKLSQVNGRLEKLTQLARKHNVTLEELPQLESRLQEEFKQYEENQIKLTHYEGALKSCLECYQDIAAQLTEARVRSAAILETAITDKIQTLGMSGGQFKIYLQPFKKNKGIKELNRTGNERVAFYLSASPGQPLQPLSKSASGGELSRLSLVIQALMASINTVPTLIFDEVDVGVGGSVAEKMGHLLKSLSVHQQVLCITHLPQVAVLARYHYRIEKQVKSLQTVTCVSKLDTLNKRVQEIARMLGGIYVTDQTISYAESMLKFALES